MAEGMKTHDIGFQMGGLPKTQRWEAPLYWEKRDEQWWTFTLCGMQPVKDLSHYVM